MKVRHRWRLVRLSVVLLAVIYLTALTLLQASSTSVEPIFEGFALVGAGAVGLLGLGIAATRRHWKSPGSLLALCGVVSLVAVAALHTVVEVVVRNSMAPYRLFGLESILREVTHGYWPTLTLLLMLLFFALLHADSRTLADSLIPLPILVWGLDSTKSHWLGFTALADEPSFFLQVFWLGTLVSTTVLLALLVVSAVWRARCGMVDVKPRVLALVGVTILAVYADWTFSLFVTSMLLTR